MPAPAIPRSASLPSCHELTRRERVGQTAIVQLSRHAGLIEQIGPEAFLSRYPVGGFFVGGEVIKDGTNQLEYIAEQIEALQRASRIPLLIAADLENGGGDVIPGLTPLPFPMCLGATRDEALAYDYGQVCACEGTLAGINWNYGPLVDLALHPLSANIGNRSLGDDPAAVFRLAHAIVRGLQENGMAACAKTFPGDGTDFRDQHLTTTCNHMSEDVWWETYGRLFQKLFGAGLSTLMTGHFSLPARQTRSDPRGYLPATLCPEITTRLLKQDMGFRGLVVSDGFGMSGILKWGPKDEVAVQAIRAGTDMILFSDLTYLDRLEKAMSTGEVSEERLEDALGRIWQTKQTYAAAPRKPLPSADIRESAAAVGGRTAHAGATLAWSHRELLPLNPAQHPRLLLIAITPNDKAFTRFRTFADLLREAGFHADLLRNLNRFSPEVDFSGYERILYLVERQFHRPLGVMDFSGEESHSVWAALTVGAEKSVVLNFGTPFLTQFYFECAPVALNFYSAVPSCLEAARDILLGRCPAPGRSPVNLTRACEAANAGACGMTVPRPDRGHD